jgi:hypothetical protein
MSSNISVNPDLESTLPHNDGMSFGSVSRKLNTPNRDPGVNPISIFDRSRIVRLFVAKGMSFNGQSE